MDCLVFQRAIRTNDVLSGNFEVRVRVDATPPNGALGVYPVAHDALFNPNIRHGGMRVMPASYLVNIALGQVRYANSLQRLLGGLASCEVRITRTGSTLRLYRNSTRIHVWSQPNSTPMRLVLGNAAANLEEYLDVSWTAPGPPLDMTLVSQPFAAVAQPANARLVLWEEDVSAVTLNTDLLAAVSRDGGTTWSAVTLVDRGTFGVGRILTGSTSVAGQPGGTSLRWRVRTFNAKEPRIRGAALGWD